MMDKRHLGRIAARRLIASMAFLLVAAVSVGAAAGTGTGAEAGVGAGEREWDNVGDGDIAMHSSGAEFGMVLSVSSGGGSMQLSIFLLAIKAVMKLVVSCAIGFALTKKGILDQNAISSLSKLIIFVFQPSLLFVNVAATLGNPGQSLSEIAVLPVFAVIQILLGSLVGRGMAKLLHLPAGSPQGRELRMCASFGNAGPLPLLFVGSLFGSNPESTMATNAVAYVSFYLLGFSPLFWTVGYTMLAGRPLPAAAMSEQDQKQFRGMDPVHKLVARCLRVTASPTFKRVVSAPVIGCVAGMAVGMAPWGRLLLLGKSAPLSPVYTALQTLGSAYTPASILVLAGSLARPPPHGAHDPHHLIATSNDEGAHADATDTTTTSEKTTNTKNTNTTTTKTVSTSTTTTKPTNANKATKPTTTTNATALLETLEAAEAGECISSSTPATTPPGYGSVPSASSHSPSTCSSAAGDDDVEVETGAAATATEKRIAFYKKIAAIMASRFVLTPLIMAGMLGLGSRMGLVPSDKLIWFVLLMLACMPSAQNSVVMLQMEKKPDLAASMSATLAVVYVLSAVPMAILLSAILQFLSL